MMTFCIAFYESYLSTDVGVYSESVDVFHREITVLFRRHSLNKKFLYMNLPPAKMRSTKQKIMRNSSLWYGLVSATEHIIVQSARLFNPVVQIGPSHSLAPQESVAPPSGSKGGDTIACGGRGWGDLIQTMGKTLLNSRQCCGSGSGIRFLFDPGYGIWDPG